MNWHLGSKSDQLIDINELIAAAPQLALGAFQHFSASHNSGKLLE